MSPFACPPMNSPTFNPGASVDVSGMPEDVAVGEIRIRRRSILCGPDWRRYHVEGKMKWFWRRRKQRWPTWASTRIGGRR
jgi:hypothetical protein